MTGNYGVQTHRFDGVSMLRLTRDPNASARRDLVLEAGPPPHVRDEGMANAGSAARAYRGIRTDDGWKHIRYGYGEGELCNLDTDLTN